MDQQKEVLFTVGGMHCAACSSRLERVLNGMDGVQSATVSLAANSATVVPDPALSESDTEALVHQIEERAVDMGFTATPVAPEADMVDTWEAQQKETVGQLATLKARLWPEFGFTILLLLVSMGHMWGLPLPAIIDPMHSPESALNHALLQLVLTLPVLWSGRHFYLTGLPNLWRLTPNMDSLVAMGTGAAFLYSLWNTVEVALGHTGKVMDLYYESAAVLISLISLGKYLEAVSRFRMSDAIGALMNLTPETALRLPAPDKADQAEEVPVKVVRVGDYLQVKPGGRIPVDGVVTNGASSVDASMLTGESMPVAKRPGSYVYAGTVVEEGQCVVCVEKASGGGRYDRIVRMIEESEKLKSTAEDRASRLADRLVPYTLGGTALTYLLTRNVTKTLSVLMVDFSCALKLAIPIAVLSAMRECSGHHISVKGGRFMEAVAQADTIVFDKTGTLTYATPRVAEIVPFGGRDPQEMLRLAACLEEHYPHSMANAVVEEARARGLSHEEYHSQVQYVVAHGISSMVEGEKVLIGSAHFVFEDEGCRVPEGEDEKFRTLSPAYSHLYLCIAGELAAVICIHDPLRREAKDAVKALHESGFTNVVMMTGDNRRTAEAVAAEVGVDAVYAEVLPEDKAAFIRQEKEKGHTVIMVGDGVNDSPALSEADAGIAISTGAAIAREIADITVASEDLFELVTLRKLSEALMDRIHGSYRFIVAFNLSLITLGVAGVLPPAISALLHNTSTLGIGLKNMTDLLEEHEGA